MILFGLRRLISLDSIAAYTSAVFATKTSIFLLIISIEHYHYLRFSFTKVIFHTLCDSIALLRIALFPGIIGALLNGFLSFFLSHYLRRRLIIPQKIVYLNLSISETLFSVVAFALRGPGCILAAVLLFSQFCRALGYYTSFLKLSLR